jgi:hypothetical protein
MLRLQTAQVTRLGADVYDDEVELRMSTHDHIDSELTDMFHLKILALFGLVFFYKRAEAVAAVVPHWAAWRLALRHPRMSLP